LPGFFGDHPEAQSSFWYGPFDREANKRVEEAGVVLDLIKAATRQAAGDTPLMVDVGACKGGAFRDFARKGWTIHAFEPNPPLFEDLVEKFDAPNVTINNSAVSDVAGEEIPFYTSQESIGISSLKPFRPTHEVTAHVKTVTLNDYLVESGVDRIEFLKIDTEGFDLMVLKGLDLNQYGVETILCEFEDSKTQPLGYSTRDLAEYLRSFGYTIYVSEWHPVVRYGGPHQWRALKRYPCELEDPDAWGNLFAFKSDPGIWAITKALKRSARHFEERRLGKLAGTPPKGARDASRTKSQTKSQTKSEAKDKTESRPTAVERKLQIARDRIRDLELQLSDVFGSTSWRITAPLRSVKSASDRVLQKMRRQTKESYE
jgi:FkbM family methyltransferase